MMLGGAVWPAATSHGANAVNSKAMERRVDFMSSIMGLLRCLPGN